MRPIGHWVLGIELGFWVIIGRLFLNLKLLDDTAACSNIMVAIANYSGLLHLLLVENGIGDKGGLMWVIYRTFEILNGKILFDSTIILILSDLL